MLDSGHLGHCQLHSQDGHPGDAQTECCFWGLESTVGKGGIRKASPGGRNFRLPRFQLLLYMSQGVLPAELTRSEAEKEQRQRHTHTEMHRWLQREERAE